jgi:hypothetical protein
MPDAETIYFASPQTATVGQQIVYFKTRWQDDWVAASAFFATERNWALSPTLPTAQLRTRYGDELNRFATKWRITARGQSKLRQYVRIDDFRPSLLDDGEGEPEIELDYRWVGILDIEQDQIDGLFYGGDSQGSELAHARGKTFLTAYGLETLLDEAEIRTSKIKDGDQTVTVRRGLTFNPREQEKEGEKAAVRGNRSPATSEDGTYLFHNAPTGGETWSTKHIVRYLLKQATIRDSEGEAILEWELHDPDGLLHDWDQPEVPQHGLTVGAVLRSLLSRQRLLSFTVEAQNKSDSNPASAKLRLTPISLTGEELTLETGEDATFKANPNQVILALEENRGSPPVLKRSAADGCDQVIVRGGRRTSIGTFSLVDLTLAIGWTLALEVLYEAGASGDGDYPASGEVEARINANLNARQADKFRPVYARFVLPVPWEGLVGDGLTGDPEEPLMPPVDEDDEFEPLAPDDQRFLPELPLLHGYDYSSGLTDPTESGSKPHQRLHPLVLFPRPGSTPEAPRYRHAESIGIISQLEVAGWKEGDDWTASSRVDHRDGSLWVTVHGKPQDYIAGGDFSGQAEDLKAHADYRKMLVTAAVPWSAYAEGIYPETAPADKDAIRTKIIEAGEEYRLDYVAPQTVLAIKPETGELQRSDAGGYVHDDRPRLKALARLAYEWYGVTRRSLTWSTSLVNSGLELGDFVQSVGDPEIETDFEIELLNSVVTSIRLATPLAEGSGAVAAPIPTITYETSFGELDVLKLK